MNFIEEKILEKGNLDKLKLRFPPEPNGAILKDGRVVGGLHLGHAKSIILNFGLAEKYNAPCVLRFDDTNPSTERKEFVDSMIEDVKWLGYTPSEIRFTSDYFDFLYNCAVILIKKGLAYVDDSTSEEIALMKGTTTSVGKDSPYKSRSIEENLDLFNRMRLGEFPEGSKILRANIDMASPNMILRDPVLYRIISKSHHRTGDTWKIYPMYDFAHPLSDYKEGITDSLCTLEFEVHRPLYMWVLENCDLENPLPEETEFARLNIDYTVMSKRKLKRLVEESYVDGWDDPRMPTISGLRRRGFTPEAIKDFCDRISVTRKDGVVSYSLLEECLRTDLNKRSRRLMGVMDPVKLVVTNLTSEGVCEVDNNPEDETAGKRKVDYCNEFWIEREDFREEANNKYHRLKLGGEVRLKGLFIVKANEVVKDKLGEIVEIRCTYDYDAWVGVTEKKVKGTIHWVSVKHGISMRVNEYERLFIDATPDKSDEDFTTFVNPNSLSVNDKAFFESGVIDCKIGEPVQMMRKGYYVLDKDGKSWNKTVSLKEGWVG